MNPRFAQGTQHLVLDVAERVSPIADNQPQVAPDVVAAQPRGVILNAGGGVLAENALDSQCVVCVDPESEPRRTGSLPPGIGPREQNEIVVERGDVAGPVLPSGV